MKNLKQIRSGSQEMADLSSALQKGDFSKASEAFDTNSRKKTSLSVYKE